MGRSFDTAATAGTVDDFNHSASDTHYSMSVRDGKYYQRRWQIGPDRKEINAEQMRADFVIGSGNHARTYLHCTPGGKLIELPLGWYAEKGGYWALNPGYDSPHPPSHRAISYECMFCHNAYPSVPGAALAHTVPGSEPVYKGTLPQGIDCQRCHGPGTRHIRLAHTPGSKPAAIRVAIVNPARLTKESEMEVCLQCHLETTSTRLPSLIRRFDRGPFSYIPGQALGNFVISFDRARTPGEDRFEIAGSAYRFRQSKCFLSSKGEMTCTTCHNPHDIPRGSAAVAHYAKVCRGCHAATVDRLAAARKHSVAENCAGCHMPRRRTDDAVHVVMTDHLIQRRPPERDLLAELPESHPASKDGYRGEVVPYYPSPLPPTGEDALYLALAQIQQGSNLTSGIQRLTEELARRPAARADFYIALGDAWHEAGNPANAAKAYEQAARLQPESARAVRYLGISLNESGQPTRAIVALRRAVQLSPMDAQAWFELGLIASKEGRTADALAGLQKANAIDPDLPDVLNSIGMTQTSAGNLTAAETAFREALRTDPYYGMAQGNLARLLAERGDLPQAIYYFAKAARLQPRDAANLYEYALTLVKMNRFEDSQREVEAAVRADPNLAEAHELLGGLLARNKDLDAALREYREAVRLKPEFGRAQLDLAATLAAKGDLNDAIVHFRDAAKSSDPRVADAAAQALRRIGGGQ